MRGYEKIVAAGALIALLFVATSGAQQRKAVPAPSISELKAQVARDPRNFHPYIKLGMAYLNSGEGPRALDAFQRAVKISPSSAEAHNWLGVALMAKADLPGAIPEFRKAVSLDPKYARAYTNLGSALAKSGDITEAVTVFQKVLALEPGNMSAHMNLGVALREKGDAPSALLHVRRVAKAQPDNASVQYELGQTLRQNGDLAGAIQAFEKALEIDPELREGYYGLGTALKQQSAATHKQSPGAADSGSELYHKAQEAIARGELDAAKSLLIDALRADDNSADAHNLLGFILGQQGEMEAALTHLERAVRLRSESSDAHYNFGVALWYSGAKDHSVRELRESVRLDPAAGASHAFLGFALRETGDLPGSRVSLQRAISLLPPMTATYIDLGIVYLRMDDLEKALGQLEAGLNLPSTPAPAPDWDAAVTGLQHGLANKPENAEAHNVLGLILGRKGANSKDVIAEFQEAVRLRSDYAEAQNNLGLVLAQSDKDDAAVAAFREAIRLRPDFADAHANLGATLTATDVEQATRELEKAVALDPGSVKARFNLALAYAATPGTTEKQIAQLKKVIAIQPTHARAHVALGKALLHDGKAAEAVAELQQASRLDPKSGEAHYQLGLALARAGKQQDATAELGKGRELSAADERQQNAELDISEGRAALQKGELEEAANKFRHAIKLAPESPDAQDLLALALEKQGDAAGAAAAYRRALELNPGDVKARNSLDRLSLPDLPVANANANSSEDDLSRMNELEGYIRESRFSEVEPLLKTYVQQQPSSSWGWYALGYSQFAQQKIGESIQSLAKSLQLDIHNAEAHKILGRDLMMVGRFDAAQMEFEQGIRYSPQSAEMHYDLGKLFSIQDNWKPARQEFESAIRLNPEYIEALDGLGFALEALGDGTGAVANYEKAIALNQTRNGKFVSSYVNLSAYYNRSGNAEKGLDYANQALAIDSKSDAAWFQKGKAAERMGKIGEAVEDVNKAIALSPRASSYYYVLAGLYRKQGKAEDSQKALATFTRLDKESNDLEKMRRSLASHGAGAPGAGGERE